MATRREEIFRILKKGEMTAQDLANHFKTELKEITDDLKHLTKSVRPAFELRMRPAYCKKCGFEFRERSRIKCPSKCPRCKGEWINPPVFFIQRKAGS